MKKEESFRMAPLGSPEGQLGIKRLELLNEFFETINIAPGTGAELCINYVVLVIKAREAPPPIIKEELEGLAKLIQKLASELP